MDFQELGLTANEAKTYETMLRLGKTTASHISKESGVPYGRIYTVLASLEEKGLVRTVPEGTKKYVASNPEKLHEIVNQKIKGLQEIDNKIKEYKLLYADLGREPVIIAKGKNSFYKITREQMHAQHYSYTVKYTFDTYPRFLRGTKERVKRGIELKTLGKIDKETLKAVNIWKKIHKNIKPIANEGIAMSIEDDREVMIGLIKSNTVMLINDEPFAKLMKELFLSYYETHDEKGNKIWKK